VQYVERKRLASLGLTSALGGLPGDLADAFIVIDSYLDELRTKDSERARRRKGG
jgi:hypothetical protein